MGAKRRNTTFWPSSTLKADASYPAQVDMTTGAGYVDCMNLKVSSLRILMASASNKIYVLCNLAGTLVEGGESGKVNAWARYKPGTTAYDIELPANCDDNPTFTYTPPGTARAALGDYAAYNHYEDTRPVYWLSLFSGGEYIEGISTIVHSGLSRGKLCPVIQDDPEDEEFWGRVKVQAWLKAGAGSYSLVATSDYVNLSEVGGEDATAIYTIGDHSETTGVLYTVCLRPVYMDTDDTTPLAVCEGGVSVFQYSLTALGEYLIEELGVTVTDVATGTHNNGTLTVVDYDFTIDNPQTYSLEFDVQLHAIEAGGGEWEQMLTIGTFTVPGSDSLAFTNSWQLTQLVDAGTFNLDVRVKAAGTSNWYTLGRVASGLTNYGL
jgi:hypothetical protein